MLYATFAYIFDNHRESFPGIHLLELPGNGDGSVQDVVEILVLGAEQFRLRGFFNWFQLDGALSQSATDWMTVSQSQSGFKVSVWKPVLFLVLFPSIQLKINRISNSHLMLFHWLMKISNATKKRPHFIIDSFRIRRWIIDVLFVNFRAISYRACQGHHKPKLNHRCKSMITSFVRKVTLGQKV